MVSRKQPKVQLSIPRSHRSRALTLVLGGALLLLVTGQASASDVVDTWKHRVKVEPSGVTGPVPVVLFLHGCNGLGLLPGMLYPDTRAWVHTITQAGWRFVAPDSLARGNRPDGCQGQLETALAVRLLRLAEIDYAVQQLATDPTVDQSRIVLLGHSEGGIAVATDAPPSTVAGIIISGWTCHASVPLGVGIAAPPNLPVLALEFEHDSFIAGGTHSPLQPGRCSEFFPGRDHATELIIPGEGHTTGASEAARVAVTEFLGGIRTTSEAARAAVTEFPVGL